jgi:polar amino acid transport system substrate-binding protein
MIGVGPFAGFGVVTHETGPAAFPWPIPGSCMPSTLGLQARIHIVPFDSIVPGLQAGRHQAAAGEIFITPERTKVVTFVQDHVSTDSLLVNTDNVITAGTENALCGRTLSVQVGSAEAALAASIASACHSAGKAALVVQTLQEEAAVNLSVFDGRADAAIGSTSQVAYVLSQAAKGVFKTVELPWSPKNAAGIALARGSGMRLHAACDSYGIPGLHAARGIAVWGPGIEM